MNELSNKTNDLNKYIQDWWSDIEEKSTDNESSIRMKNYYMGLKSRCSRNPSFAYLKSMVLEFAQKLPYSMDIEQEEFVPGDFLNVIPDDFGYNEWFYGDKRKNFFIALVNNSETFKTGMLLQLCNIFQKMILGELPSDFSLSNLNNLHFSIDGMPDADKYNEAYKCALVRLPEYYQTVTNAKDNDSRREALRIIYSEMKETIGRRVGLATDVKENGDRTYYTSNVLAQPDFDLRILTNGYNVSGANVSEEISKIREAKLKEYNQRKKGTNDGNGTNDVPQIAINGTERDSLEE